MFKDLPIHLTYLIAGLLVGAFIYARFAPSPPAKSLESKTDTVYIERIIKKKDGSVVVEKIVKQREEVKVKTDQKQYRVSLIPSYKFVDQKVSYGASIERRIFRDLWMGIHGSSAGDIGVSVSLEF